MKSTELRLTTDEFDAWIAALAADFRVMAPVRFPGRGRFSEQDVIRYAEVTSLGQIVHDELAHFSPKELVFPITQTLQRFKGGLVEEPAVDPRGLIVFLRACDIHGFGRLDAIFLKNGPDPDFYYARLREKVKFVLLECRESFSTCFCVSMGANRADDYAMAVRIDAEGACVEICDETLHAAVPESAQAHAFTPEFPTADPMPVTVPDPVALQTAIRDRQFFNHPMWEEYAKRCIGCGRCNTHCVTCSCFSSYDVEDEVNPLDGERRRVWAGCHIDRFTDMAGGHKFRDDYGSRMRFKAMHKIYDFHQRFGEHMCVGCGRCDVHCPEYISFAECINKISRTLEEER
jgi:anaerobic sulfite reductase subunit A